MTMRQSAGGAGDIEEPERGLDSEVADPAGRPVPFVQGPTGPAPLTSESHGDPGAEGDRGGEGGAVGGAIAGTAVAGPIGGVVGGLAGGAIGTASVDADGMDGESEGNREHAGTADPSGSTSRIADAVDAADVLGDDDDGSR